MAIIDIYIDFRRDSKCGVPDTDSQKLYEAHKLLWSKELPNGKIATNMISFKIRCLISWL